MADQVKKDEHSGDIKDQNTPDVNDTQGNPVDNSSDSQAPNDKKTYTEEEVEAMLSSKVQEAEEKVRSEAAKAEKDKLYDSLKKKDDDLLKAQNELSKFREEKAKREEEAEKRRLAKLSEEERQKELIEKSNQRVEQLETAFTALQQETQEILRKKDLELIRKDLIAEAKGEIIPELVSGDTPEELKESVEKAKVRYKELVAKVSEKVNTGPSQTPDNQDAKSIVTETPHQRKPIPTDDSASKVTAEDIFKMDDNQFQEHKESILKRYGA